MQCPSRALAAMLAAGSLADANPVVAMLAPDVDVATNARSDAEFEGKEFPTQETIASRDIAEGLADDLYLSALDEVFSELS